MAEPIAQASGGLMELVILGVDVSMIQRPSRAPPETVAPGKLHLT